MLRSALAVLCTVMIASPALGGGVTFSTKPSASREGEKVRISFAVSAGTDVEVAVLDAGGGVVRHLAAGVLGAKTPPPPPLAPGLSQSLQWDLKDDLGKPAAGGPFKVRVRAGMGVEFGRMIGASPYTGGVVGMPYRAPVNGLVCDVEGRLYVKMMSSIGSHGNSGLWPWHVRRFDRKAEYQKTILPYPPSTPPEKASGMTLLTTPDGLFTPANQNSLYGVLYVFANEIANRLLDGQMVFVHSEARQLKLFKLDGSNALRVVDMFPKSTKVNCARWLDIQVAFSPDGKYAYYSNLAGTPYDGKKPEDIDANWPQGRVYRHDLFAPEAGAKKFFDLTLPDFATTKYWMPSAWDKKTAAAGIDVDAKGNVLVCDLVNGAVVEISPEGKKLSSTKVPWPDKVMVNRRTGDLYVISRKVSRGGLPAAKLHKISGRGDAARTVAELQLKGLVGAACALDETAVPPVIWLAGTVSGAAKGGGDQLVRVEDRGAQLAVAGEGFLNRDKSAIKFVGYADVDAETDLIYVTKSGGTVWRFDGQTGEGGPLKITAVDLAVGPGGHVYTWGVDGRYQGPVARFDRDLKPAPAPGMTGHTYGELYGRAGRGSSVCGMDVDRLGRVYATWGSNSCHVRVYGLDGKLADFPQKRKLKDKKKGEIEIPAAVDHCSGYGGSIRVDLAGNIYLLQKGRPKDYAPPPGFEKDQAWAAATGTILKFGPQGARRKAPVDSGGRGGNPLEFSNTLRMYPGCGPISQWRCAGSCACTKPRFEVDGYGRLYIPNAMTFKVSVRDNSGNGIVEFGGYGNFDCQGPESAEPKPEIPMGWPVTAGASDRYIYVGDCLNHRVVRADKTWAAEDTVAVN
jgi:DNA-binding beta-propeller fold protein YncE